MIFNKYDCVAHRFASIDTHFWVIGKKDYLWLDKLEDYHANSLHKIHKPSCYDDYWCLSDKRYGRLDWTPNVDIPNLFKQQFYLIYCLVINLYPHPYPIQL